jgi:hypothetical protein
VGDEAKSASSQVTTTERVLHEMLALVDQNILCLIWDGPKRVKKLPMHLWLPSCIIIPSCILFLQLLPLGSVDKPALQAEVIREWEASTIAKAARITVVLVVDTSAQEVAMV